MNLPAQSTCFPSAMESCFPIATRSILFPLITTVAFGNTLPSAGLITVAPTSEIFSARTAALKSVNAITSSIRNFIREIPPSLRIKLRRGKRLRSEWQTLFFRFRHRFLRGFEADFGMRAVAKRFLGCGAVLCSLDFLRGLRIKNAVESLWIDYPLGCCRQFSVLVSF